MLWLTAFCHDFIYKRNYFLVDLMRRIDRLDHLLLRHLVGSGFDHDHLFPRRSNGQLQIRTLALRRIRIDDKLTVYQAYLCGCTWTVKRDIGYRCRNRRT